MTTGVSVNIGVGLIDKSHYGTKGRLAGAENDARSMELLAKNKGFGRRTLLVGKDAATTKVEQAVREAAASLVSGDTFFLSYSGHGGQIPQLGQNEPEGLDEGWCLVDRLLVDDEIQHLLGLFKPGVHVVVVVDSCHSGTPLQIVSGAKPPRWARAWRALIRNSMGRPKALSSDEMKFAIKRHPDVYRKVRERLAQTARLPVLAHVVQISACQDHELTPDGSPHSPFTADLLRELGGSGASRSIKAVHQALVKATRKRTPNLVNNIGTADPNYESNHPFLQL